jgi:hypothetical protein
MTNEQEYANRLIDIIESMCRDSIAFQAILNSQMQWCPSLTVWPDLRKEIRERPETAAHAKKEVQSLREGLLRAAVDTKALELLRKFQSKVIQ